MSKVLMTVRDDPQVWELVKGIADPSLTKQEVSGETGEREELKDVAPAAFLVDRGGGISSKWLY
jgi:hypothetical protein